MAEVTFPAAANITRVTMGLSFPGQVVHRPLFGATPQVLERAVGFWRGLLTIAPAQGTDAEQIEAFFAAMHGGTNFAEVPHQRPTLPLMDATPILTVSAGTGESQIITLVVASARPGMLLRVGNRSYIVTGVAAVAGEAAQKALTVQPSALLTVGAEVSATATIRARSREAGESVPTTASPDWAGPWNFEWVEDY